MLTAQSPLSDHQIRRRIPLQLKNPSATSINKNENVNPNLKPKWIEIPLVDNSNKENHPFNLNQTKIESLDVSLAEELSAMREKLERLRRAKEKTEKELREKDFVLDMQMKEMEKRGEMQRMLEIEVDRLYRLKELRSSCMRISPIRSLREKQQEKKIREDQSQSSNVKIDDGDEWEDEIMWQSPSS